MAPRHPIETQQSTISFTHTYSLTLHTQNQLMMSKNHPPPKRGKTHIVISPTPSDNSESPMLAQLKTAIKDSPGVVRNSTDACRYLEGKNYMLAQQENTITVLTTVLLSLVVNTGPCAIGD